MNTLTFDFSLQLAMSTKVKQKSMHLRKVRIISVNVLSFFLLCIWLEPTDESKKSNKGPRRISTPLNKRPSAYSRLYRIIGSVNTYLSSLKGSRSIDKFRNIFYHNICLIFSVTFMLF